MLWRFLDEQKYICVGWMVNDNNKGLILQDETGDECRGGKAGEIPSRGDTSPRHGMDGANLKVKWILLIVIFISQCLGPQLFSQGTAWRRRSWTASTWPGPWTSSGTWRTDRTWRELVTTNCVLFQLYILLAQLIAQWYSLNYLYNIFMEDNFMRRLHSGWKHLASRRQILIVSFWKLS